MVQTGGRASVPETSRASTRLYPGFVGAAAFTTAICRPSSVGDILRFRGYDIRGLVGIRPYDDVWRLLVDDDFGAGPLAVVEDAEVAAAVDGAGSPRVTMQRALLRLAESRRMQPSDGTGTADFRDDLAVLSAAYAIGLGQLLAARAGRVNPVGSDVTSLGIAHRLVLAWRGSVDDEVAQVVDTLLSTVAEHGTTASTLAARVVASTGADAAACLTAGLGAMGGPRHGGATRGAVTLLRELSADRGSSTARVEAMLDAGRRLPGVGHRVYRTRDPRVPILRRLAQSVDAPLLPAAEEYLAATEAVLTARRPEGRNLPANPDLWLPVILDGIGVPDDFMDAFLAGARIAGWSAHSFEQVATRGPLLRPDDVYAGHDARCLD